ncbi:MAG: class I SAM-dependent methyltransferase [Streptosporangiaceae bacterium]
MTRSHAPADHQGPRHRHNAAFDMVNALSMTVGRGSVARAVADLADLTAGDQVVDIGCGPGAASRVAASRCAHATGVDPSPAMLRLGRWLNALRVTRNVTLVHGSAESIPLADRSGTVVWALRSVHHWSDRAAGLAEAFRVLAPGGRLLLAERVVGPGAHGGLTGDQADQLVTEVEAAGFTDVRRETLTAGRRALNVVRGSRGRLS